MLSLLQLDGETVLAGLVITNIVIYLLLLIGLRRPTPVSLLNVSSLSEAFEMLERSLRSSFPDLPEGFTWQEGITRAEQLGFRRIDWNEVRSEVESYEAFRYGGKKSDEVRVREVLKLAMVLPRARKTKAGV